MFSVFQSLSGAFSCTDWTRNSLCLRYLSKGSKSVGDNWQGTHQMVGVLSRGQRIAAEIWSRSSGLFFLLPFLLFLLLCFASSWTDFPQSQIHCQLIASRQRRFDHRGFQRDGVHLDGWREHYPELCEARPHGKEIDYTLYRLTEEEFDW